MPKRKYALISDGPLRLEVEWEGGWFRIRDNIRFRVDGNLVGSVPTRAELEKGFRAELGDGSVIEAQFNRDSRLEILYNGNSLSKIAHPQRTLKALSSELLYFSALSAGAALVAYLDPIYASSPILGISIIFAILMLLFGFLIRRSFVLVAFIGVFLPVFFILFLEAVDGFRFAGMITLLYFLFRTVLSLRGLWRVL